MAITNTPAPRHLDIITEAQTLSELYDGLIVHYTNGQLLGARETYGQGGDVESRELELVVPQLSSEIGEKAVQRERVTLRYAHIAPKLWEKLRELDEAGVLQQLPPDFQDKYIQLALSQGALDRELPEFVADFHPQKIQTELGKQPYHSVRGLIRSVVFLNVLKVRPELAPNIHEITDLDDLIFAEKVARASAGSRLRLVTGAIAEAVLNAISQDVVPHLPIIAQYVEKGKPTDSNLVLGKYSLATAPGRYMDIAWTQKARTEGIEQLDELYADKAVRTGIVTTLARVLKAYKAQAKFFYPKSGSASDALQRSSIPLRPTREAAVMEGIERLAVNQVFGSFKTHGHRNVRLSALAKSFGLEAEVVEEGLLKVTNSRTMREWQFRPDSSSLASRRVLPVAHFTLYELHKAATERLAEGEVCE